MNKKELTLERDAAGRVGHSVQKPPVQSCPPEADVEVEGLGPASVPSVEEDDLEKRWRIRATAQVTSPYMPTAILNKTIYKPLRAINK
jgi:hypothetical protein